MFFGKKPAGIAYIVVFLGNPGPTYESTRHNAGFMAADFIEKRRNIRISRFRFNALTAVCELGGQKALLMKPQTYMNLSGKAVLPACTYYKLPPERVIVVCDDISLSPGALRVRAKGSSGGHNGLKSIIAALGTEDFPRIKIGVGSPPPGGDGDEIISWVTSRPDLRDRNLILSACERAGQALETLIEHGAPEAMSLFNSR
ncbi:MAG: aminoacyl-tRNA hydrolase [Oscillospiraceae bacterium]|jgi:PTH1 family peptidyl-tRNA hydrolase|nr:aminoacyl-tRNA hydrolase [Oscillospiraceae bacterium]